MMKHLERLLSFSKFKNLFNPTVRFVLDLMISLS